MKIDVCFSPALYPFHSENEKDTIVVVVDIFRASTSICAAFGNGVSAMIPVASLEEAKKYKEEGFLIGAERNVKRCDFADFGNSPSEYTREKVAGKEIVFTTTNGTQAVEIAAGCYKLIIGAFSNISAIAKFCIAEKKDVMVLCAGWNNRFNIEDTLFGGALAEKLLKSGFECVSDSAIVAKDVWEKAKDNLRQYIEKSEHIKRLYNNSLHDVVDYCLAEDTVSLVPVYDKENKRLTV